MAFPAKRIIGQIPVFLLKDEHRQNGRRAYDNVLGEYVVSVELTVAVEYDTARKYESSTKYSDPEFSVESFSLNDEYYVAPVEIKTLNGEPLDEAVLFNELPTETQKAISHKIEILCSDGSILDYVEDKLDREPYYDNDDYTGPDEAA